MVWAVAEHDSGKFTRDFIGPSQSWFGRLPNVTVANIHAISSDIGDAGDATANAIVAALIDDVA